MDAFKERKYISEDDKKLKLSGVAKKSKLIDWLIQTFADLFFLFFRKISSFKKYRRGTLLIISLHRLGDTVFTIPAIKQLINFYHDKKIKIISFPSSKDIYELELQNVEYITVEKENFCFGRRIASSKIRKLIREIFPEIIYDITGTAASASMIFNSPAKEKIGLNIKYFRKLYTTYTPIRTTPHFMDIYLDAVKLKIDIPQDESIYTFPVKIIKNGKVLIHPFAIRAAKEWGLKNYFELARVLNYEYDVEIIAPPGFIKDDVLEELYVTGIKYSITNSIKELITKLNECSVFISNDSGPTYISSLLGKPTFTIYGPTNPAYSLPFGSNHRYFQKIIECSADDNQKFCFTMGGIHCPSYECMKSITVDEVAASVKEFLEELKISKRVV